MTIYGIQASQLIEAIRSGRLVSVINAIDDGAQIDEPDIHGFSGLPLRTACFTGNLAIVRELLSHGANPNAPASDGPGAPLRLALRCRHFDVAALLLQAGAIVPDGITVDPAVYAISCAPLAIDLGAPTLPVPADNNLIEFEAVEAHNDEPGIDFGTQTNALGTDLLFLEEDLLEPDIGHLALEPLPEEKPRHKS